MIIKIMKMKQNGGDNEFDDVDDYNYFDLNAVFDTSRRHLQLVEGVRVARQVLQVGEQDPAYQHFVLQAS